MLERSGLLPGSHDHKALIEILETYPRDELFQIAEDELLRDRARHPAPRRAPARPALRPPRRRSAASSPASSSSRASASTPTAREIQEILQEAFGGESADYTTRISESVLARLHYVVYTEPGRDARLRRGRDRGAARRGHARLDGRSPRRAGRPRSASERAGALHERYGDAFPGAYRDDFTPRQAVHDIDRIERLGVAGRPRPQPLRAARVDASTSSPSRSSAPAGRSCSRTCCRCSRTWACESATSARTRCGRSDATPVWIYDFGLQHDLGAELRVEELRETFQDAFEQVWHGEAENDGFNRLVLAARLTAREITILRAIAKYLRQAGSTFSQAYMEDALAEHPDVARGLVELFVLRLDPARPGDADKQARTLEDRLAGIVDGVASLDEDRILRGFLETVRAVLRTNYFQADEGGRAKPYLSLKLDPKRIPDLPEPRPMFEVYVYSTRVEAVHLRGGKVARGGIRWSDRQEDFRTEVLGLMKAQSVKNAVIVPVGAKGGFVVKRPPPGDDRAALLAEVVECYRIFMRGLLDVTDTIAAGEIVPPRDVVRHDEDDPYLVVAADKGTATFSDIANAISQRVRVLARRRVRVGRVGRLRPQGRWGSPPAAPGSRCGGTSASSGSTSRRTDFTVVGIGDMSGDVFGNGMLLSRHIKLVGAFDHRHVFLDPDPDPEQSFAERERLFELPGSSWADYDPALISPGGGVFPRTAKSIPLSPEVRAALGVEAELADAERADPRAPARAGRPALERRHRHLREGARRARTPRWATGRTTPSASTPRTSGRGSSARAATSASRSARAIAFALGGGRIYMDAIDNSAGVDCSDHEVNIKILLDAIVADGDLTGKQRNELLAEMTDEVAALVLRDNYGQAQALTSSDDPGRLDGRGARALRPQPRAGRRPQPRARVPAEHRGVRGSGRRRRRAHRARVRDPPLAHEDRALARRCSRPTCPTTRTSPGELALYFPSRLRQRFPAQLERHPLRREIVATRIANDLVNRAGTTFLFRLGDETGAAPDEIARAYTAAREVAGLRELWAAIEALDGKVPAKTQTAMLLRSRILLERTTRWLLRHRRRPLDIAETVARYAPGAAAVAEALPTLLGASALEEAKARAKVLTDDGVPADLAGHVSRLLSLVPAPDLVEIAASSGLDVTAVAETYFGARGAARAAVAARPDRRPAARHALDRDGTCRAARRRLRRAGEPDRPRRSLGCERTAGAGARRDAGSTRTPPPSSARGRCSRTSAPAARSTSRGSRSPCASSGT